MRDLEWEIRPRLRGRVLGVHAFANPISTLACGREQWHKRHGKTERNPRKSTLARGRML